MNIAMAMAQMMFMVMTIVIVVTDHWSNFHNHIFPVDSDLSDMDGGTSQVPQPSPWNQLENLTLEVPPVCSNVASFPEKLKSEAWW